jgi:hypothetical protein
MAKTDEDFLAGAASCQADPPLGLPISGVVRREGPATSRVAPLEVTAVAFALGSTRVVLCGVDTLGIQAPEVDELRSRIAARTGADPSGILLNWNHTHHAPPGCRSTFGLQGDRDPEPTREILAYIDYLHGRILEVCQLACERLEPADTRWGLGRVDEAINRRQRDPDGKVTKIGWNPEGLVDPSVPVLQALRENGSAIATVVSYGCHTVTTGIEYLGYSPDYPGPLRDYVRRATGGECVFLQGAGGNIMPRIAFEETGEAMKGLGTRLGIEALHAVAGRQARPARLKEITFGSGTGLALFRWEPLAAPAPSLAAVEKVVEFPLLPLPTLGELAALIKKTEGDIEEATKRGATEGELRVLRYHGLNWARRAQKEIRGGSPRTSVKGSINAVRIGDGVIATGPGEVFTEIGLAVKERSPADVTLYAGFTNGAISYLPTAAEFPLGGYEPSYGNKPYGLPAQVTPECERILTETAVSLIRSLFPERTAPRVSGWLATGRLPESPSQVAIERPAPLNARAKKTHRSARK